MFAMRGLSDQKGECEVCSSQDGNHGQIVLNPLLNMKTVRSGLCFIDIEPIGMAITIKS